MHSGFPPIQIHGPKSRPKFIKPLAFGFGMTVATFFHSCGGSFYDPLARIYACRRRGAFQLARLQGVLARFLRVHRLATLYKKFYPSGCILSLQVLHTLLSRSLEIRREPCRERSLFTRVRRTEVFIVDCVKWWAGNKDKGREVCHVLTLL